MSEEQRNPESGPAGWERHKLVIIAAVAAVAGNADIREIRPVRTGTPWTRHGRIAIQGSHDVTRQRGTRGMPDRRG